MLHDICKSATLCPLSMRVVLQFISARANKQIPEYEIACISNIMFLRFFGTALANLKKINLGKRVIIKNKRVATILAKLMQQLVNSITADGYEYANTDDIIQNLSKQFINAENQNLVFNYFVDLINEKGMQFERQMEVALVVNAYQIGNALCVVRNFISSNLEKLLIMSYENNSVRQMLLNFIQVGFSEMNIKRT